MVYYTSPSSTLQQQLIQLSEGLDCDELLIVSGYVGPGPLMNLTLVDGIKLNVIFGLATESVSKQLHEELLRIENENKRIKIFYSNVPSHVKIYMWRKKGVPVYCVNGSANFTSNGLLKPFREILALVPASQFKSIMSYIKLIQDESFSLREFVPKVKTSSVTEEEERIQPMDGSFLTGSLYAEKSKINWGHGNAHTHPRDAYIPISSLDVKKFPNLFPPKTESRGLGYADNDPIDIIWDDGVVMTGILEGTQNVNGVRYPNKIGTYRDKKILGDYLRGRMGLELGVFVTESDFIKYGRDNVGIKKIGDSTYQFDFSKPSIARP
jgi:hypothetical protein